MDLDAKTALGKYLLWDVDGTLLRNGVNAGGLYSEAVALAAGRALEFPTPLMHGKTDGQILWETLAANGLDSSLHDLASVHLDELSRQRHLGGSRREIAPGIVRALAVTADLGWINSLLTGNSAARTRYKMEGAELDHDLFDWGHSYFGDRSPVRSEVTLRAAGDLAGNQLVIIGDTPGDGIGAEAAGIPFIAIATGHYSAIELKDTGAVLVIDDLVSGFDEFLAALVQRP